MTKKSAINGAMLLFSLLAAIVLFAFGEALLTFLQGLPFFIQCGIYLTFVLLIVYFAIYLSEKISTGNYIPKGRVTFDSTFAKAAAIFIPCAFALGLLTQLAYGGIVGLMGGEIRFGPAIIRTVEDIGDGEWIPWWVPSAEMPDAPLMPVHDGMQHFFTRNSSNLHGILDDFAASYETLGPGTDFETWLRLRSPHIPANAPSFLEIGDGYVPLAFQAAVNYTFVYAISFLDPAGIEQNPYYIHEFVLRDGYRGPYRNELLTFWNDLDTWAFEHYDACNTFIQYWRFHIDPVPIEPVIVRYEAEPFIVFGEIPHLLLSYSGPGWNSPIRIALQSLFLSIWGIFIGVAVIISLNNSNLFRTFLIPRIFLSIAVSVAFSVMFAMLDMEIDMIARGIYALGIGLLFLPTYFWGHDAIRR